MTNMLLFAAGLIGLPFRMMVFLIRIISVILPNMNSGLNLLLGYFGLFIYAVTIVDIAWIPGDMSQRYLMNLNQQ